jgi:outer membrane biosynthesis protein TonB
MHRTIRNTSRLAKVVRTVGITLGIVAGSASAASAVNSGSFVPSFLSEPTTTAAPSVATTTPKLTKAPEPTPTTKAPAPTTTRASEPTTAKALEPTPTTTKAPQPTPTTAKELEPTPTTTKAPEPTPTRKAPAPTTTRAPEPTTAKAPEPTTTPTTNAPEVHTPESLQLSCERKTDGDRVGVTCSWTGDLPTGGSTFMLLRGGGGVGRVLVSGPNAHSFIDSTIQPGVAYSYTAVIPGAPGSPTLAHSNQVLITG